MFNSSAVHKLSLMAPKPQRFRQFAVTTMLAAAAKKPRTLTTNAADSEPNTMKDAFAKYASYLNDLNEKRERVVKASRDITMNSKKVIFQVHRISKHNKEEVLEKAEKDLAAVMDQHISRLVQEYVEAATLCNFCKNGTLLDLDEINASLRMLSDSTVEPLQINVLDYLLGIADLTGELMRLAIGRISDGELEFAQKICRFVREIYRELMLIAPKMDDSYDMKTKMDVMLQSVIKVENACFSVHVRGSEYIPFLGSEDTSFSLLGVPDDE
ncbi:hypothetical protein DH2020_032278 [Rehmannia glutinosa]|uniref:Translin-associated protein X n=1 Tax=Rehmannia glutinosa TaxID=99300 RepID=A0ABR0VIJ5_REHGL